MVFDLRTIKRAKISKSGVILFAIVRDEDYIMPHFLAHYRAMGVADFLIYADRCSPEFLGFLEAQPDVALVTSDHAFGDRFGLRRLPQFLKENLPDSIFPGRWVLTVDADEFLVLPPPALDIAAAVAALEQARQMYCLAPMVDLYPATLAGRNYGRERSPFDIDLYFDRGPYFRFEPGQPYPTPIHGGIRERLIGMLSDRAEPELRALYGSEAVPAPVNIKTPLLRHGMGYTRRGSHAVTGDVSGPVTAALLHFKFTPALDRKVACALAEGQYEGGSIEYRVLDLALRRLADEDLRVAASVAYTGTPALIAGGLLPTSHPQAVPV